MIEQERATRMAPSREDRGLIWRAADPGHLTGQSSGVSGLIQPQLWGCLLVVGPGCGVSLDRAGMTGAGRADELRPSFGWPALVGEAEKRRPRWKVGKQPWQRSSSALLPRSLRPTQHNTTYSLTHSDNQDGRYRVVRCYLPQGFAEQCVRLAEE